MDVGRIGVVAEAEETWDPDQQHGDEQQQAELWLEDATVATSGPFRVPVAEQKPEDTTDDDEDEGEREEVAESGRVKEIGRATKDLGDHD